MYMCVQLYPASTSPLNTTVAHPHECHVSFLSRLCKVATLPVVASQAHAWDGVTNYQVEETEEEKAEVEAVGEVP